ncbi:MAG TPA: DUF3459 domain-containing protein, partial [Steroidobacteraceae bacterium]|nr:DUF3459 domain-containing protein [Steroidobacteraceae bacterium]
DYRSVNVQTESADPESLLNWYRRLIALRRSNAALRDGRMVMLDRGNPKVLSYARVSDAGEAVIVVLNMSPAPQTVELGLAAAGLHAAHLRTLLASPSPRPTPEHDPGAPLTLAPYAAWVAELR